MTGIREAGGEADFAPADLADTDLADTDLADTDLADTDLADTDLADTDLADTDLDAMLAVNVRAPHVLVAAIAPAMAGRGSGVIITIGSWLASVGSPFAAMYTATKAAGEQMTRSWAAGFGPLGVRVNTVAPGVTRTPGNEDSLAILEQMTAGTPAGSPVQPEDIAYAAAFLAPDEARMVHGITLYADGGITATRLT